MKKSRKKSMKKSRKRIFKKSMKRSKKLKGGKPIPIKIHMSYEKIESFSNVKQILSGQFPKGYFYTFGKKQCKEYNEYHESGASFFYKFNTKNCNILVINTIDDVKKFFLKYHVKKWNEKLGKYIIPNNYSINWKNVAKDYDGVEFYDPLDYRGISDDLKSDKTIFYYNWKIWGLGFVWKVDKLIVEKIDLPECIIEPKSDSGYESYGSYDSD